MTNKSIDHYSTYSARQMTLAKLMTMLSYLDVRKVFVKPLSPNDNSKNQPYFGSDYSVLNIIPTGQITAHESKSRKKTGGPKKTIFRAPLDLTWVDPKGQFHPAKNAKLILYPQYPEVRFSGYLQGSSINMSEWMLPEKQGRSEGRFLVLGVTNSGRIFSYLAIPNTGLSKELSLQKSENAHGVFFELNMPPRLQLHETGDLFRSVADAACFYDSSPIESLDTREQLITKLREIHNKGWINSKRLDKDGNELDCNAPNCGGYTLEAELGVTPNGYSEPDYLGWEIKQYGVTDFSKIDSKVVTLMTPEPTGGVYQESGVEAFLRQFGYEDLKGRADRINFGGIHKAGIRHERTNLTLLLDGFDPVKKKITDADGGIILKSDNDTIAAKWHFSGILEHWKRKHNQAAYIPSLNTKDPRQYRYGNIIKLGEGTDVAYLLAALSNKTIYYDPGIKMENASSSCPNIKRRSQFRIKSGFLDKLYKTMTHVDLNIGDIS